MDFEKLSPEQCDLFRQFEDAVSDCRRKEWNDEYMLKWLVARDFNVARAETMLRRSIEWRRINLIDKLVDCWNPPEVLRKYYSIGSPGCDKHGCPVWLCAYGRMDMVGILNCATKRDYVRYVAYFTEQSIKMMRENSERTGKSIYLQTLVFDMEELSVNQLTHKPLMDVGLETIRMAEANYPEGVRRVFLINVPPVFTMVFAMIKPFLGPATLDKLRIFGHDPKAWKAALLEEIDADQLPAHYGGSMTDPDGNPMCLSKVSMGGEVPKSYYPSSSPPIPSDDMKSVQVAAGSRLKVDIAVSQPEMILRWKFLTANGDIGFQIFCIKDDNEEVMMVPRDRLDSHKLIEDGEIACIYSGIYVIEFDNSFSFFRSKDLWYKIDIVLPE